MFGLVADRIESLARSLEQTLLRDRWKLRGQLRHVERLLEQRRPVRQEIARLEGDVARSNQAFLQRQARAPRPTYPAELPVVQKKDEIAKAIAENQVVVICGETGSGKTTQIPKICLELGRGVAGLIGHTQPRRIAARSVAARIAFELNTPVGGTVGFKIRFLDNVSPDAFVKVMTDGILLAETQRDRFLNDYDTIIIDEAHERSLNIDFLLGYLKQLLPKRPDLKLIITSATIDPQGFSKHFNNAPIVMVSGRTFPVEVRYRPLESDREDEEDIEQIDGITRVVGEILAEKPASPMARDILVFLPGEREIRETAEAIRKSAFRDLEVLPLYARLGADEQMRVFGAHSQRRVVLATNVAETSLTVPGIGYVIDTGAARISRYNPRNKVQRLPIEPISRASADQRKGRCGRLAPGVCFRLFAEDQFLRRPEFTDPEILRTNLAAVILQMKALRLGEVQDFPFLEPPDYRAIRDGFQTLHELGAIDEDNELTDIGLELARLPIDPRIGRMILQARHEDCLREVLIIATALAVQDPRERPMEKEKEADAAQAEFRNEHSDFLTFLNIWRWYHEQARSLSQNALRRACKEKFLSFVRLREWHDIHQQILRMVTEMGLDRRERRPPPRRTRHGAFRPTRGRAR